MSSILVSVINEYYIILRQLQQELREPCAKATSKDWNELYRSYEWIGLSLCEGTLKVVDIQDRIFDMHIWANKLWCNRVNRDGILIDK